MTAPGAARTSAAWPETDWVSLPEPAPPVALYVHIPFCVSLCPYCDFVVLTGRDTRGPRASVDRYVRALQREMSLRADVLDALWGPPGSPTRPPLETLYLGGGTPSLLPAWSIAALIRLARERHGLAASAEVTVEANPGRGERGDARALREAGVTRMSYGAQSMDARALRRLGRRHTPDDVRAAVAAARAAGIGSVSLDLLLDVPDQPLEAWATSLEAALALEPDHLSIYGLTLAGPEASAPTDGRRAPGLIGALDPLADHLPVRAGARRWRHEARAGQDEDRAADAYRLAEDRLAAAGYRWYEISNWARPGAESRHNLMYWTGRPWAAAGIGAHAFDGLTRTWVAAAPAPYLDALDPPTGLPARLPPGGEADTDPQGIVSERLILALRLAPGVPAELATDEPLRSVTAWALGHGLLEPVGDRLRLTLRGRLLSNEVFARLI